VVEEMEEDSAVESSGDEIFFTDVVILYFSIHIIKR